MQNRIPSIPNPQTKPQPTTNNNRGDDCCYHVFGLSNPMVHKNRYWNEAVKSRAHAWKIRQALLRKQMNVLKQMDGPVDQHQFRELKLSSPVWCFNRIGMTQTHILPVETPSQTKIISGKFSKNKKVRATPYGIEININDLPTELQADLSVRKIILYIGGQHQDEYDPDYCIYNDVILQVERSPELLQSHEQMQITPPSIIGFPRDVFPPTNHHTATLVSIGDNNKASFHVILIGNEGYKNGIDRDFNSERNDFLCPVYSLDLLTFKMERKETSSKISSSSSLSSSDSQSSSPGLISGHRAKYIEEEDMIYLGSEALLNLLLPNVTFNDGIFKTMEDDDDEECNNDNDEDEEDCKDEGDEDEWKQKSSKFMKRRLLENDLIEMSETVYYTLCMKTFQWTQQTIEKRKENKKKIEEKEEQDLIRTITPQIQSSCDNISISLDKLKPNKNTTMNKIKSGEKRCADESFESPNSFKFCFE